MEKLKDNVSEGLTVAFLFLEAQSTCVIKTFSVLKIRTYMKEKRAWIQSLLRNVNAGITTLKK